MKTIEHWIRGKPHAGSSGRTSAISDPSTGQPSGEVSLADVFEVDAAIGSATEAFESWRRSSLTTRQSILFAYRELLFKHKLDIATAITSEHGKTLDDALGEVQRGIEVVEFSCNIAHLLKGDHSEQVSVGVDTYSIRQPLGVVAGITPFNFPVMVPMWMYPVAIACGNTFVLKPSEKVPSAPMIAAELFREAGLPPGVLNLINGDKAAVDAILEHPDVAAVSFVGSTPVAKHIYETGSKHGKRVQALGGAKNHMLVLPDADMDMAADAAVSAGYGSAGERCMAISVIVTVGDASKALLPKITERIASLTVGPGLKPGVQMGPLITAAHRERVEAYVESGEQDGARLVVDGRGLVVEGSEKGFYFGPTLFEDVNPGMAIYDDEIFGPVLSMVQVDEHDEAIELINANAFGNGTAIFTRDGGAARRFTNRIEVGMVGINVPLPVPLSFYSFGGWKQSLFGSQAIYGPEGVSFYTRQKVVISRWPDQQGSMVDLGFPQHDGAAINPRPESETLKNSAP